MGPFDELLTQNSGSQVAPETLEMLGRQASQMFQTKGVPLNQAVSQVLSSHPELKNEHIKRIVEFANTVTFQEMFQNSTDKNVHFDVADPGVILRDLKDGGSPGHEGTLSDYQQRPAPTSQGNELDTALMQQFTGSSTSPDQIKTASERNQELHANPLEDAWDAQIRLQATRDKLAESHEQMDIMLKAAQEDFYQQVRLQVADDQGSGLGGVIGALSKIAEEDIVEALLTPVAKRLVKEGFSKEHLDTSMKKTAGAVPNLEHPLFASADAIVKLASEILACDSAITDVDAMLVDTNRLFKNAGALTTGVKKAIGNAGHVPAGVRQRFPRD